MKNLAHFLLTLVTCFVIGFFGEEICKLLGCSIWWIIGVFLMPGLVFLAFKLKKSNRLKKNANSNLSKWVSCMEGVGLALLVVAIFNVCGAYLPNKVDKERFVAAEDYHVLEAYLDGYVSSGDFNDTSWLAVYPYLEGRRFSDEQLAVITYYAMWCGDDFAKMPVATILMKKEEQQIIGCDFIAPFDSGHKLWILRAVWAGELSLKELRNFPHGSCYLIDVDELKYDSADKCQSVVTKELRKRLKIGPLTTGSCR